MYTPESQVQKLAYVQKVPPTLTPCRICNMKVVKEKSDDGFINRVVGFHYDQNRDCTRFCFANLGSVLAPFLQNPPTQLKLYSPTGEMGVLTKAPNIIDWRFNLQRQRIQIDMSYDENVKTPPSVGEIVAGINNFMAHLISAAAVDRERSQIKQTTEYKIWKSFDGSLGKMIKFFEQQLLSKVTPPVSDEMKLKIRGQAIMNARGIQNVVRPLVLNNLNIFIVLEYIEKPAFGGYVTAVSQNNPYWDQLQGTFDEHGVPLYYELTFDGDIFFY